jgi:hypothetical protein
MEQGTRMNLYQIAFLHNAVMRLAVALDAVLRLSSIVRECRTIL